MNKNLLLKSVLALAVASPLLASAESDLTVGAGSATAKLNLRIVIPRVLFLGVGTGSGTPLADNNTVDEIAFDYTANPLAVGAGAGSPASSITNGGVVPVRVYGNDGQITITATNPTNLTSGTDTIAFSDLSVSSSSAALPAPAFDGGTSLPTVAGRVTNQTANWTYSYANTATPAFGAYTGTVTYTATMP
ncbi:MAG: hypothetical protein KF871_00825 [Hydrogenophaga sp.]|uniref:hypothetical protein n=1 Tax=Hydrogenophaga sp. TaxID=1904254 RepID=UPI001DBFDB5C|nr:hypothetical protein [Hydrogenophaga sp.]MBX3608410.1 hypothetical protein [Hydrogenophaga sp.]